MAPCEEDKNPVCIVGAGFQRAVLDRPLPSTADIIPKTLEAFGDKFPALRFLEPLLTNRNLNYVWTNIERICQYGPLLTPKVIAAYETEFPGTKIGWLVEHLKSQREASSSLWLLWVILGVELKKMLALQYEWTKLTLKEQDKLPHVLKEFLGATKTTTVTWISLNYDLALESILQKYGGAQTWRYGFEDLFEELRKDPSNEVMHVVVKPHGSLNIWFNTVWESRSDPAKRDLHQLSFVNPDDLLQTCAFEEVGCVNRHDPAEERRPWVIGYLPDMMKDELSSPGNFADAAHDLCKWNLTYAALALQKASSLYILAYSMPDEDRWIWARLAALRRKDLPVYVASGSDTERIINALKSFGFGKAEPLTDKGWID